MSKRFSLGAAALLSTVTMISLAACEGPDGPVGPAGASGEAGAPGPQGPIGLTGPAGTSTSTPAAVDGGLTTSCMSPCHGFGGIVDQWKSSTHYFGVIENTDEVPTWTADGAACGNCHASDGLPGRLAGNVTAATLPTNLAHGELGYKSGTGAFAEAAYAGSSAVATIGCTTCHDALANDPHVTGGNYVKGSFALRTPHGVDDQSYLEKSPDTTAVTGMPAGKLGVSNTCVMCHKSRKDVTNYISTTASNSITSPNWGPHEGPHADIYSGLGGYNYGGKTYNQSTHQSIGGCSGCHMTDSKVNGYPDHSFRPTLATCVGAGCHATATSFDVAGGQGVVKAALGELRGLLNGAPYNALTRDTTSAAPGPLTATDLADKVYGSDKTRKGASLTADQAGALYNYLLIARGSAYGVHNPVYTKELLFDSISLLKGSAPNAIPTRP